jgi:tetratricopeptide (TPR) repeat protein
LTLNDFSRYHVENMIMKKSTLLFMVTLLSIFSLSCVSTTMDINDEWQAELYFKRAQDAANSENYKLALQYYAYIIEAFGDMSDKLAMAHYEIGVLYFRLKAYNKASDQIALVEQAIEQGEALPDWLPVLTVMMRGNIDANLNEAALKQAIKDAKRAEKEQKKLQREAEDATRQAKTDPSDNDKAQPAEPQGQLAPVIEPDPEGWGDPSEWLDL